MISFQGVALFVADMKAAKHFYVDILGQQVAMDNGDHVALEDGLALWGKACARGIVESLSKGSHPEIEEHLDRGAEVYFESPELKAVEKRLKDAQVTFVHGIKVQPWQQPCLRVLDPDGRLVEIAEPFLQTLKRLHEGGMSMEELAETMETDVPTLQALLSEAEEADG